MTVPATKVSSVAHTLHTEIEAARTLLANMRDILGDDTQAQADAVEGETNLLETVVSALARVAEIEVLETGIAKLAGDLKTRQARLGEQKQNLRTAITVALEIAQKSRLETPLATVALMRTPAKVEIVDEASIPARFWKAGEPKLDKKAVAEALKAKEDVPGARMDNGGITVMITGR